MREQRPEWITNQASDSWSSAQAGWEGLVIEGVELWAVRLSLSGFQFLCLQNVDDNGRFRA